MYYGTYLFDVSILHSFADFSFFGFRVVSGFIVLCHRVIADKVQIYLVSSLRTQVSQLLPMTDEGEMKYVIFLKNV